MAARSRMRAYRADEVIFAAGEPGDAAFVVVHGVVRILESDAEGVVSVIAEMVEGDTFGELDLLDGTDRNATAVAGSDVVVLRFPAEGIRFDTTFSRRPDILARVLFSSLRVVAARIRRANALIKENSPWVQEAQRQVYGDKLTGLFNKTFLEEKLPPLLQGGRPLALIMLKPDNFKSINDTWGHEAGDAVLRLMAAELSRAVGEGDIAARHAGNALAAVLPGRGREAAAAKAAELRAAFNRLDLAPVIGAAAAPAASDTSGASDAAAAASVTLTASFGIAVAPEHGRDRDALIAAAVNLPLIGRERGGNLILFPEDAR